MSRQQFSVGQEIVSEDLNSLQSRGEREFYDGILHRILGQKSNAFFQDSMKVSRVSSLQLLVNAGLGIQTADTGSKEPTKKPIYMAANETVNIDTPDSSNPRIDIITIKYLRENSETESRKFKDEFTDTITTQNTTVSTIWSYELNYVAGTPDPSPVAPATPAGYIKLAEIQVDASTGIPVNGVTDSRALLPIAVSTSETGSPEYDAIVGVVGTDQGANYSDLKSALDNAQDGWKILVLRDEEIDSVPVVLNNKIEIVFKRGVTFSRGTSVRGLQVNGNDCKIINARFLDFSTSGDFGIYVNAGALRTVIMQPRFNNCDGNISDNGTQTFVDVAFTE